MILLDACAPAIAPLEVATQLGASARTLTVVVWGATRGLRAELAQNETTHRWLHIEQDTTSRQLAELLASLI